ncbi:hypothetical protein [Gayadomonas joobiniege]|uniref:hypothetical protein n=1 Tax=Gayadomonas joobiniege TaxID=1234606 RepID=UPI00035D1B97|nr:hypothetical protein [Gayadomonas joobiniege]
MGQNVRQIGFSEDDFAQFKQRLCEQVWQLKKQMRQPEFAQSELKVGAELELYLTDHDGHVRAVNQKLIEDLQDTDYQHEINQYNLELNFVPTALAGQPFSNLQQYLEKKMAGLIEVAEQYHSHVAAIGILPGLRRQDLLRANMTPISRYEYLVEQLKKARAGSFAIKVDGQERIDMQVEDVTAEGANTSFQVHMMIPPGRFADVYNAAVFSQPLVTALAANSPLFLGRLLWEETRIPLLRQMLDCRARSLHGQSMPARVTLGAGWLNDSAWDLYAQAVALHPVLLPELSDEPEAKSPGQALAFKELNLHMGTVWNWHRPVYCAADGGHIRLEFRALPAGPSVPDMIANLAFSIGLAYGFGQKISEISAFFPFELAEKNFLQAARYGLNAQVYWPDLNQLNIRRIPILNALESSMTVMRQGLTLLHIEQAEITNYLTLIEQRLQQQRTGASWQRALLYHYEQKNNRHQACLNMFQRYLQMSHSGMPVGQWSIP